MNALSKFVVQQFVWLARCRESQAQMTRANQLAPLDGISRARRSVWKCFAGEIQKDEIAL